MKGILANLWAESLKIRRSKIFGLTILAFSMISIMAGFLMFVLKNPEIARKYSLISAKAAMAGKADWLSYFGMLSQVIAVGGIFGFGFVTSWVFGREYSDRTVKDILALPVSRSCIVLAKFVMVMIWCMLLSLMVLLWGLIIGKMINLAGWSHEIAFHSCYRFMITVVLTILLCTPVAFFASYGRGYLPPLGFVVLAIVIAQVVAVLGYGPYFPWAIPALYSGAAGPESARLGMASYLILFGTSISGLVGAFGWWRFADQF
jgi:ABC-2 type transport system permease protein